MSTLLVSPEPRLQSHASTPAKKTKGGYTRQRRGCLTCRQRKKKCDQGFPTCGHCSRLNFVCKREKPRELQSSASWGEDAVNDSRLGSDSPGLVQDGNASEVLSLAKICKPLDLVCPDVDSRDANATRRSMMRYYTTTLAVMLSATAENNCFLSVMLPMAFDCPTLLDAMAAWSSAHLAMRYPSFHDVSLQHRGRILSNLGAALQDNSLSGEMCLAVALAMCSMETISDATTGTWAHHLAGAAAALQAHGFQKDPSGAYLSNKRWLGSFEGRWLLRNFAYHDILMSVALDRRPLLTGDYWMSTDDTLADPYCAYASKVLYLTSEISVLNADCVEHMSHQSEDCSSPDTDNSTYKDGGYDYDSLLHKACAIAAGLREWECPVAASGDAALVFLSETYRSAALIYLNRVVRKHFPRNVADIVPEGVWVYVESICDIAQKVPEGSLAECSLLFSLFIAGGEAEDARHIECIRNRLYTMNKWRRFRNVDACREVLDDVWRHREQWRQGKNAETVDWRDIAHQRGWRLALT